MSHKSPHKRLSKLRRKHRKPAGLPPGTVVHTGERVSEQVVIRAMRFTEETCDEKTLANVADVQSFLTHPGVKWIDVAGLHDTRLIEAIGKSVSIHPLAVEDIANTHQRPKIEDYPEQLIVYLRDFERDESKGLLDDQVTLILGKDYVLTFCEREPSEFDVIRERIRNKQGQLRLRDADYLLYRLLDILVDQYFELLDTHADEVDRQQAFLLEGAVGKPLLQEIMNTHDELLLLRRSIAPLKDALSALERRDSHLISPATRIYFRDVHDHAQHAAEMLDTMRELGAMSIELYISRLSLRQNDVMRVLTVIATIFLPLTFLVGIWGMNFDNMPELHWKYGYFLALGLMAIVSLFMLFYFKRKRWTHEETD
ncbi:magnesium/cobalt transporter CorA [bacterium]|nr:magnesium/cobalt transporter CorA [bacterium]